jgi:hypothetical protein
MSIGLLALLVSYMVIRVISIIRLITLSKRGTSEHEGLRSHAIGVNTRG